MSHPTGRVDKSDHLLTEAAEAVAVRAPSRFDRAVLRVSAWLAEHTRIRVVLAVALLGVALTPGIVLLAFPGITDQLTGFRYGGVFLTNLASTATFYFPVPGLTAAAQTIIATEGEKSQFPWLVGVLGGLGMAIGEITAYYAGYLGAEIVRGRELPGPKRFHSTIERVIRGVNYLMKRWGMLTLFGLSVLPNPFFEVAGLTAGSVRMAFRRFFVAVVSGKIVRGIILAYFGADALSGLSRLNPFG